MQQNPKVINIGITNANCDLAYALIPMLLNESDTIFGNCTGIGFHLLSNYKNLPRLEALSMELWDSVHPNLHCKHLF
jgi:hypothetical protein